MSNKMQQNIIMADHNDFSPKMRMAEHFDVMIACDCSDAFLAHVL